jgi:tetratricopeptide (TPR) repeat protein
MGRFDTAIAAARHGVALDPLNPLSHLWLADALYKARRYAESIPIYRESLALNPHYRAAVYAQEGLSSYMLGDLQMARTTCETTPQHWQSWVCLAVTYDKLGMRRDAEAQIPKLVEIPTRYRGSPESMAYQWAQIDAQWGNKDKALNWLEKAVRLRDSGLPNLKTDPLLDPLRDEPRFRAIERQLKFPT